MGMLNYYVFIIGFDLEDPVSGNARRELEGGRAVYFCVCTER